MARTGRAYRDSARTLATLAALAVLTGAAGCVPPRGTAPRRLLTFDALYGPERVEFSGHTERGLSWRPDGRHYAQRRAGVLTHVDPVTEATTPAYDTEALARVLEQHAGMEAADAKRMARRPTILTDDYAVAVFEHDGRLLFHRLGSDHVQVLSTDAAARDELTLSPDRAHLAYRRDHEVCTLNTTTATETRLTTGGSDTVLNGKLDWVYQEEVYGRGHWRAYWWSEDGAWLAFLQLDQGNVPVYTVVDHMPTHPEVHTMRYPKAGDPNSRVRLGVARPGGGALTWVDLARYNEVEPLVVNVGWSPAGELLFCVQDRESRWLELNAASPETGAARVLIREESPAWVESYGLPHWLDDGTFLWRSARDGWIHVYHYRPDGTLIARVTSGAWDVNSLHGVDARDRLYFSSSVDSFVETHAYRVALTGGVPERLTEPGFSHRVDFDPKFQFFFDSFSNLRTPTRLVLRRSDGDPVRVISANEVPALDEYIFSPPELLRIPTPAGHQLNGELIRPPRGTARGKRPVMIFTYGGPGGSAVHNRWSGTDGMFKQLLAQRGYLVWTVDPYSASGEGPRSAWHAYQRLGVTEVQDLEASLRWLAEHENADLERVGIEGHSYGGYLVAYALTHSKMFRLGIAGLSVTDWRNYDSIYTERYMRTPANNREGYEASSVLQAAKNLHGRLLLVHGTQDDNVHLQNTLQLCHELQQADKQFDLMLYPRDGHGLGHSRQHWLRLRLNFIEENL